MNAGSDWPNSMIFPIKTVPLSLLSSIISVKRPLFSSNTSCSRFKHQDFHETKSPGCKNGSLDAPRLLFLMVLNFESLSVSVFELFIVHRHRNCFVSIHWSYFNFHFGVSMRDNLIISTFFHAILNIMLNSFDIISSFC